MAETTRRVLRCVYVEAALTDDELAPRALEACDRAAVEVVALDAELPGSRAWIDGATLWLDGEELAAAGRVEAVARHLRARACAPADAIAVATGLELAPAVGTLWLAGHPPGGDPLLALELDRHPNVRLAGESPLYEAVVTTLMERR